MMSSDVCGMHNPIRTQCKVGDVTSHFGEQEEVAEDEHTEPAGVDAVSARHDEVHRISL